MVIGKMSSPAPDVIVTKAILFGWEPTQLKDAFNDMPLDVAEGLLEGIFIMQPNGVVIHAPVEE